MKPPKIIRQLADWLDKTGWLGLEWSIWVGFGLAAGIAINLWIIFHFKL